MAGHAGATLKHPLISAGESEGGTAASSRSLICATGLTKNMYVDLIFFFNL